MADTNTANIGLLLPDLNDTFNFGAHVEANFTTIDGLMGAVQCTSTSRPTNTYAGQIIYETDSKRYAQNTGTKGSPAWTYMSHQAYAAASSARPTVGLTAGELLYETDNALVRPRGAAGWLANIPQCTSSARPANPVTGDLAVETDTQRLIQWNGSSWLQKAYSSFPCTSGARPASPFQGLEIYETDTTLSATYSGSAWQYGPAQIAVTQTVSGASSVTFSAIPAVKRVQILWRARLATGAADLSMQIDGDTGSHYLWSEILARAAAAAGTDSGGLTTSLRMGTVAGTTASYYCSGSIMVDGWNASTNFATISANGNAWDSATSYWAALFGGLYTVGGPHTSVKLFPSSSTFSGEFSLYGWM